MIAKIIDGKQLASQLKETIKKQINCRIHAGKVIPGLAVILVGNNPASLLYVRNKRHACNSVGMKTYVHNLERATTTELITLIDTLNVDPNINGILVQLPLPPYLDKMKILERIHPDKDIDGFHPYNLGRLCQKKPRLRPCTPYGVIQMLHATDKILAGQNATIIGASNLVGRPMAMELLLQRCTPTITHRRTNNLADHVKRADIVIAAAGQPNLIKGSWIKPGAIVIDVGINHLPSGKIVGDVEFDVAVKKASWITPVPGGVGPMTVATLLKNTLLACELQENSLD